MTVPISVSSLEIVSRDLVSNWSNLPQDFLIEFDVGVRDHPCRSDRSDLHLGGAFLQRNESCLLAMVSGHPRGEAWAWPVIIL